jgi:hypothetical protein
MPVEETIWDVPLSGRREKEGDRSPSFCAKNRPLTAHCASESCAVEGTAETLCECEMGMDGIRRGSVIRDRPPVTHINRLAADARGSPAPAARRHPNVPGRLFIRWLPPGNGTGQRSNPPGPLRPPAWHPWRLITPASVPQFAILQASCHELQAKIPCQSTPSAPSAGVGNSSMSSDAKARLKPSRPRACTFPICSPSALTVNRTATVSPLATSASKLNRVGAPASPRLDRRFEDFSLNFAYISSAKFSSIFLPKTFTVATAETPSARATSPTTIVMGPIVADKLPIGSCS